MQEDVMVSAHLMSIQIDDGCRGDAFHSLEQKLRDEWKHYFFLSENDSLTIYIFSTFIQKPLNVRVFHSLIWF